MVSEVYLLLKLRRIHYVSEQLFDRHVQISRVFRGSLEVGNAVQFGQISGLLLVNVYVIYHVDFVPQQDQLSVLIPNFLYFFEPVVDVFIALAVCYIIDEDYAHSTSIVTLPYLPKPVLTRSIPNLYSH